MLPSELGLPPLQDETVVSSGIRAFKRSIIQAFKHSSVQAFKLSSVNRVQALEHSSMRNDEARRVLKHQSVETLSFECKYPSGLFVVKHGCPAAADVH